MVTDLFGNEIADYQPAPTNQQWWAGTKHGNPCIKVYGHGPDNVKCKTCIHLRCHSHNKRNYYKCKQRGITASATTDHKVNWPTCGKYEAKKENQ